MTTRRTLWIALIGLACLPSTVLANAGTAVMWTGTFHLLFGNAVIGYAEGALIAKFFGTRRGPTIGVLIAANYFSAWVGSLLIALACSAHATTIYNARAFIWWMVGITYLFTLILEWPFIAFCFRKDKSWFRQSIKACLISQTLSYAILFGVFGLVSTRSLYTGARLVPSSQITLPKDVEMYYLSDRDGDVCLRELVSGVEKKVRSLGATHPEDFLFVRPSASDTNRYDLVARLATNDGGGSDARLVVIEQDAAWEAAPSWIVLRSPKPDLRSLDGRQGGPVPKLGSARQSEWTFHTGGPNFLGLTYFKQTDEPRSRLALETPFVQWRIGQVTHLPGDIVLFQLGSDQICVFDVVNKQVALVARGRGPVAIISKRDGSRQGSGSVPAARAGVAPLRP